MERRKNFYELTQSLSSGFFSDKIMIMLSRIRTTKQLQSNDMLLLEMAEEFFDDVLVGYKWSDNPRLSKLSLKSANSFSQAVNAIVATVHTQSFENYIQQLKSAITEIKRNTFTDDKIEILDDFFFKYSKSELQRTDSIINRTPISFPLS